MRAEGLKISVEHLDLEAAEAANTTNGIVFDWDGTEDITDEVDEVNKPFDDGGGIKLRNGFFISRKMFSFIGECYRLLISILRDFFLLSSLSECYKS